ncbi:hypothetical protein [Paraburkholderia ferrariae]|nr:hypothetical protein [Paraburkholderia ferrariae]
MQTNVPNVPYVPSAVAQPVSSAPLAFAGLRTVAFSLLVDRALSA